MTMIRLNLALKSCLLALFAVSFNQMCFFLSFTPLPSLYFFGLGASSPVKMYFLFLSSLWPCLNLQKSQDFVCGLCVQRLCCCCCCCSLLIYAQRVTSWRQLRRQGPGSPPCLDSGQNELIHDSESSCSAVGAPLFLDLLHPAPAPRSWLVCGRGFV